MWYPNNAFASCEMNILQAFVPTNTRMKTSAIVWIALAYLA